MLLWNRLPVQVLCFFMYGSLVELQVGKYLQLILKNQNFYRYKYRYSLAPKFFNYWTSFHFFVLGISLKNTHFVILHLSPSLNPCILHSFAHTPPPMWFCIFNFHTDFNICFSSVAHVLCIPLYLHACFSYVSFARIPDFSCSFSAHYFTRCNIS